MTDPASDILDSSRGSEVEMDTSAPASKTDVKTPARPSSSFKFRARDVVITTPLHRDEGSPSEELDYTMSDGETSTVPKSTTPVPVPRPDPTIPPLDNTETDLMLYLPSGLPYAVPYSKSDGSINVHVSDLLRLVGRIQDVDPVAIARQPGTPRPQTVAVRNRRQRIENPTVEQSLLLPRELKTEAQIAAYVAPPSDIRVKKAFPKAPPHSFLYQQPDTPVKVPSVSEEFASLSKTDYLANPLEGSKKLPVSLFFMKDLYSSAVSLMSANDFNTLVTATIIELCEARSIVRQNQKAIDTLIACLADLLGGSFTGIMNNATFLLSSATIHIRDAHLDHMRSGVSSTMVRRLRHAPWNTNSLFGNTEGDIVQEYTKRVRVRADEAVSTSRQTVNVTLPSIPKPGQTVTTTSDKPKIASVVSKPPSSSTSTSSSASKPKRKRSHGDKDSTKRVHFDDRRQGESSKPFRGSRGGGRGRGGFGGSSQRH